MPLDDLLPLPPHMFYVLLVLREGPLHGYGIKKEVQARSQGQIDLDPGGLYRLIARLEARGAVAVADAPADEPDDERHRVFYRLTRAGEQLLAAEARRLSALVSSKAVRDVLKEANT
jgi:DNA-binding PadR family transcriptional regulator